MKTLIFVFGSNLKGIHGIGAALTAKQCFGAVNGIGVGRQGMSYAIPTKESPQKSLPLNEIASYVDEFILYANQHPGLLFKVTRIGCGYAGYADSQIAPMFIHCPSNCVFNLSWLGVLGLYTTDREPRAYYNQDGFLKTIEQRYL